MTFKWKYGLVFLCLLMVEVLIGMYVHDTFVRPFIGDLLVVILLYSFAKTFVNLPPAHTAISVFIFALLIELLQLFNLAELLGLEQSKLAKIVLGSTFDPLDLLAYFIGIWICLIAEFRRLTTNSH